MSVNAIFLLNGGAAGRLFESVHHGSLVCLVLGAGRIILKLLLYDTAQHRASNFCWTVLLEMRINYYIGCM